MRNLHPDEKQIIATALLALSSECPPEQQANFGMQIASIAVKLGIESEMKELIDAAKAAREGGG